MQTTLLRKSYATLVFAFVFLFSAPTAHAVTAYYQPTPYPSNITTGVHVWDGWITSIYYGQTFQRNDELLVGGWGDIYRTYVRFNATGLPANVSQAVLWLWPHAVNNAPVVDFNLVNGDWNTSMTWSTQPSATYLGWRAAPAANQWWGTVITSWYNNWASNPSTSYGLRLDPQTYSNNNFDHFRSSRYTVSDGLRPILQLDFTPPVSVPSFKLPLPGNISWLVTTETGGYDCKGSYDQYHDGLNYFATDFSWRNRDSNGNQVYSEISDIPIKAASGGKVAVATYSSDNGYYVVVDHDGDGNLSTGFSTRYLHLKYSPSVSVGQTVAQGAVLGYMGNTGLSNGTHLHFGVRYADQGYSTSNGRYATADGWLLKGIQTECLNNNWIRYYWSSNT